MHDSGAIRRGLQIALLDEKHVNPEIVFDLARTFTVLGWYPLPLPRMAESVEHRADTVENCNRFDQLSLQLRLIARPIEDDPSAWHELEQIVEFAHIGGKHGKPELLGLQKQDAVVQRSQASIALIALEATQHA